MLDFFGHKLGYLRKVAVNVRQFGRGGRAQGHITQLFGTLRCFRCHKALLGSYFIIVVEARCSFFAISRWYSNVKFQWVDLD